MRTKRTIQFVGICVACLGGNMLNSLASEPQASAPVRRDPIELRKQMRQHLLAQYDLNKNGKLDPDEQAAWQRDLAQMRREGIARFDTNKDGKLDAAEVAAAQAQLTGQTPSSPAVTPSTPATQPSRGPALERQQAAERHNRELFLRHDQNGDGVLDENEQTALWTEWRLRLREKQAKQDGGK